MGKIVQDENSLAVLGSLMASEKAWVLDVETSGLCAEFGARICGVALGAYREGAHVGEYYLPIRHAGIVSKEGYKNLESRTVFNFLRPFLEDSTRVWIGHNLKFELKMMSAEGLGIGGSLVDTMVIWHCINSSLHTYSLESLSAKFLKNEKRESWEILEKYLAKSQPKVNLGGKKGSRDKSLNYSLVPIEILGPYAMEDIKAERSLCAAAGAAVQTGKHEGKNFGLPTWGFKELWKNEMELVRVLADMESYGVLVDTKKAVKMLEEGMGVAEGAMQKMWDLSGNCSSPSRWTLFRKSLENCGGKIRYWTLPEKGKEKPGGKCKGKQKGDQFTEKAWESTKRPCFNSAAVLRYLQEYKTAGNHRAFECMKAFYEWHGLTFIMTTFVENLLSRADSTGRVHGQFNQTGTKTGRLAASAPNLQNQATEKGTHDQAAFERFFEIHDEEAANRRIRDLFVPSPGKILVCWDYKSLEYRLAAFASRDRDLMEKYRQNPDLDYHEETAGIIGFSRSVAKTVNFGLLYGMGVKSLRGLLVYLGHSVTVEEVRGLINKIYSARPGLKRLIDDCSRTAAQQGYIRNPFGRWVSIPPDAAYKALNAYIQGLGGDIMRYALVRIYCEIKRNGWPLQLILTVHDEIVGEMPEKFVGELAPAVAKIMEVIPVVDLPLPVDVEICRESWRKREKYVCG